MWYAIILGGGTGSRMGSPVNKVLCSLSGEPVIRRSVRAFLPYVEGAVVVCRPEEQEAFRSALSGLTGTIRFASAGATRQESVRHGLDSLPEECDRVLVHDGARPLVSGEIIRAAMESVLRCGSGVAAIPVTDTMKQTDSTGAVTATVPRESLSAVQTPQAFRRDWLESAHRLAEADGYTGTDDASLCERAGYPVHLTAGSKTNLKLTTPEDLIMAEALLSRAPSLRIGTGYDMHALVPGRSLVLCGKVIPHTLGLEGHSDADVAVHALMDALLGAAALGDIGQHFPDTDEQYRGISSLRLLEHVCTLLKSHSYRIVNCDVTIVAQRPKLAPHLPDMRSNLAQVMSLDPDAVSVKATTTEHLGPEGREEGISAQAVALLQRM